MRIEVLGSLRVLDDSTGPVLLSDSKVASALLVLALEVGRPVAAEALVQGLYGRDGLCGLEEDWVAAHVAELQQVLGSSRDGSLYVCEPDADRGRYELLIEPSAVDALEFAASVEHLLRHGLDMSLDERLAKGQAAFALWRADPVAQHRRICRTVDRLFKRHRRLYRQLGELFARDLSASGEGDAAEDVVDAVLDVHQGDAELLELRETLAAGTAKAGELSDGLSTGTGLVPAGPASSAFHMIESQCEMAVFGLTSAWRTMSESLMADGLRSVLDDLNRLLPDDSEVTALVHEVAHRTSGGVDAATLLKAFWPGLDEREARQRLNAAVARANARFGRLPGNQLHEFSIAVHTADRGDTTEEVVTIGSVGVASLLSRSPKEIRLMEPNLRVAWGLYDAGSYSAALQRFAMVAESMVNGKVLTRTELALFFYYFAKCLLKLNMYASLEQFVESPYREFSQAMCPELEPERLQIAGVLHRHCALQGATDTRHADRSGDLPAGQFVRGREGDPPPGDRDAIGQ